MISETKIDMSLDDIIRKTKGSSNRGGFGNRGRNQRQNRGFSTRERPQRGGINKQRPSNFSRQTEIPDVWEHDMYQTLPAQSRSLSTGYGNMEAGKLLISNLEFGVNDSDIQELFAEFGPLTKAAVHYDKSGRSLGTAEVIFERQNDGVRAMKQYNNVPLDGRPMNIQLIGSKETATAGPKLLGRLGRARESNGVPMGRQRGGNRYRNPRRGGGSRRGGKSDIPTAEELDAELDAYNSKMETE